jgi:hypothetical protein
MAGRQCSCGCAGTDFVDTYEQYSTYSRIDFFFDGTVLHEQEYHLWSPYVYSYLTVRTCGTVRFDTFTRERTVCVNGFS